MSAKRNRPRSFVMAASAGSFDLRAKFQDDLSLSYRLLRQSVNNNALEQRELATVRTGLLRQNSRAEQVCSAEHSRETWSRSPATSRRHPAQNCRWHRAFSAGLIHHVFTFGCAWK
jgi:hypothetical protein